MLSRLKPKNEFDRNVAILVSGTTIAQAIPVAISPILTRIYTPADFGVFAIFFAVVQIFGSLATARYEMAVMLTDDDEAAVNVVALALVIAGVFSIALLFIVVVGNKRIGSLLGNAEVGPWLYLAPVAIFFVGLYNALSFFNNRRKKYKDLAKAAVYKSTVLAVGQLSIGVIKTGSAGLVIGQMLSYAFANAKLLQNYLVDYRKFGTVSVKQMKTLAVRYKDFPKFSMWANLASISSQHVSNILVSSFYSVTSLGHYSLIQRVLGMPSSLVGDSIGQVFFQQATQEKRETGLAAKTFDRTVLKLILIAVPTFGGLYFIVEPMFAIVFGDAWHMAGTYAKILVPFFALRFVFSSVSNVNNIFEKQRIALAWQLVLLMISVGTIFYSYSTGSSFAEFLGVLSVALALHYALLGGVLFLVSRGRL